MILIKKKGNKKLKKISIILWIFPEFGGKKGCLSIIGLLIQVQAVTALPIANKDVHTFWFFGFSGLGFYVNMKNQFWFFFLAIRGYSKFEFLLLKIQIDNPYEIAW